MTVSTYDSNFLQAKNLRYSYTVNKQKDKKRRTEAMDTFENFNTGKMQHRGTHSRNAARNPQSDCRTGQLRQR